MIALALFLTGAPSFEIFFIYLFGIVVPITATICLLWEEFRR